MPKFEHYNAGEGKEEAERLYGNDISANEFNAQPFKSAEEISENTSFSGDEGQSAEEKIYENIDEGKDGFSNIENLGQLCDDYLNNKAGLPEGLTAEDARELALIYRESLGAGNQPEKTRIAIKFQKRYTELANLKPGQIAHATPDPKEKVQLNRISQVDSVPQKKIIKRSVAA
jgi:hypothetical protein